MKKLLIAVQSQVVADELSSALADRWEIHVCGNCEVTKIQLNQLQPDALIIDLGIPREGGFSVLADCFPDLPPVIVALTAILNPYIEQNAARWGIDYVFQIPFELELLLACLGSISQFQEIYTKRVAQHLRVLGVSANLNGYFCLLLAIPFFKEDLGQQLHKEVYSRVGEILRIDSRAVERVIRTAISSAFRHRRTGVWEQYFPADETGEIKCPTNKAFIVSLAQRI